MRNPFTMTPMDIERLADLVDYLDNGAHASLIPMPAELHVKGLTAMVEQARDELKAFLKERFAYDPWTSMIDDEEIG